MWEWRMQLERLLRDRRLVRTVILGVLLVLATLFSKSGRPPGGGEAFVDGAQGVPRLVDGDSFFLGSLEVRLQGIDAPEGRQTCRREGQDWRCGEAARRELQRQTGGRAIRCDVHSKDQHGRLLATCTSASGQNLNREMVASGFAVAFGSYEREEATARAEKRGLWASEFERPKDWRRQHMGGS